MLRLREGGERIPLMWVDFERQRGSVTVLVQTLGKTTREMRDKHAEGGAFGDFAGPLGPLPMMHACTDTARRYGERPMVWLNTTTVDGTGMCGSCRVTVGGEEAALFGCHNRLVEPDRLQADAAALAASLADGPTFSHAMTKTMIWQEWGPGLGECIEADAPAQAMCMQTNDFERAHHSFAAKQKPVFEGN